jgi:membrane-bound lytic murein transglycosylase B
MGKLQYAKASVLLGLAILLCSAVQASALSESDFQRIGSQYGVSPYLLLAISIVETQGGELLGKYEVKKVVDKKQLRYLKKIARHTGRDLKEFRGSRAGAMGYMQIVPSTFYTYAQDGDGDGIKDPLNPHDSLATAAYFLARTLAIKDNNVRGALRSYNNSTSYGKNVIKLAQEHELNSTFAARQD